jgi:hypothetical protein
MEPEGSLSHSQEFTTSLYPKPDESSPHRQLYFPNIHFNIIHLGLPSGLFPSGFPIKILYAFLISPCLLRFPPISSFLIWSS